MLLKPKDTHWAVDTLLWAFYTPVVWIKFYCISEHLTLTIYFLLVTV